MQTVNRTHGKAVTAPPVNPPLNVTKAETVATRLIAELSALVDSLSPASRRPRDLADRLGVDRNAAQRVFSAIQQAGAPIKSLLRIPGLDSLREIAIKSKAVGLREPNSTSLEAAIDQLAIFIQESGGSLSRLRDLLEQHTVDRPVTQAHPELDAQTYERQCAFQHARAIAGHSSDVRTAISAVRGVPDAPDRLEHYWIGGMLGFAGDARGLPVTFSNRLSPMQGQRGAGFEDDPTNPFSAHHDAPVLIPQFCSDALPIIERGGSAGALNATIDYPKLAAGVGSSVDMIFAYRGKELEHPLLHPPEVFTSMVRLRVPTGRLLFDLYLHRSLATQGVPAAAAFLSPPANGADPKQHWYERLPGAVRIELLGSGLSQSASDAWASQTAATEFLFEKLRWNPESFVGFRIDVRYPVWNTHYATWFDFRKIEVE